jgi:hypothetical protein
MRWIRILCIGLIVASLGLCLDRTIANAQPKTATVSGRVVDKAERAPIRSAHLWIHEQNGKTLFTAQTDPAGKFSIQILPGYYDLLVGSPGFAPFCRIIWAQPGKPIVLDIRLGPDMENMQTDPTKNTGHTDDR